ncbi:hypothetical protein CAOG_009986 [Capsaspora owczarzaki ATCC 30864]|uniref:Uncharacterized protein n=1 Tax=Capsaspora owczarzaki (strain ATCC 30864) TaxID=595528 RepID=A0A0D2X4H2_CAPO3|nr:hypothetical protein CAOG_009986 [Capsaspora owczarzaki ATCC 30864]
MQLFERSNRNVPVRNWIAHASGLIRWTSCLKNTSLEAHPAPLSSPVRTQYGQQPPNDNSINELRARARTALVLKGLRSSVPKLLCAALTAAAAKVGAVRNAASDESAGASEDPAASSPNKE